MIGPKVGALRHGLAHRCAVGAKLLYTRRDVAGWVLTDFGRRATVDFKDGLAVRFENRGRDPMAHAVAKANECTSVAQYLPRGSWRARR